MNNSLTQGKSYWITFTAIRGGVSQRRTLSRPCLQVRTNGDGLFGQVYLDSYDNWQETSIWLNPDSCVEDTTPPKKGFWASLFS